MRFPGHGLRIRLSLILIANIVTTSKALVTTSKALVSTSLLLLVVRHLFLIANVRINQLATNFRKCCFYEPLVVG